MRKSGGNFQLFRYSEGSDDVLRDALEPLGIVTLYRKFNGETKTYTVEPYHLFAYHGNWYLLARRKNVEKPWSIFAVSRMKKISGTGEIYRPDETFDPRQHIRDAFGISRGEKPFKVTRAATTLLLLSALREPMILASIL